MQIQIFLLLLQRINRTATTMKANEQTLQQLERAIRKTTEKITSSGKADVMTDIHIRVTQETGELMVFDDDDNELTRCVVEQWIDNKDNDFYAHVTSVLRRCLEKQKKSIEQLNLIKPYSFVLEDDDRENIAELYVVDDDTVIIDTELMAGLDKDLNDFFEQLIKE